MIALRVEVHLFLIWNFFIQQIFFEIKIKKTSFLYRSKTNVFKNIIRDYSLNSQWNDLKHSPFYFADSSGAVVLKNNKNHYCL